MNVAELNKELRNPSATILYVYLESVGGGAQSLQMLADATGLSKRTIQRCVEVLVERGLLKVRTASPTATPSYTVLKVR